MKPLVGCREVWRYRQAHLQSPEGSRAILVNKPSESQNGKLKHLTITILPHPCSSDSKISTWAEGSSPVAVQPPSVKADDLSGFPVPKKSSITFTYIEFSPHWAATLLAGTRWCNSKGISGLCGSSGRLGKRHVSFVTGPSISSFDWTPKRSWEGLPKSLLAVVWTGNWVGKPCADAGLPGPYLWGIGGILESVCWACAVGIKMLGVQTLLPLGLNCASENPSARRYTNPTPTCQNPIVAKLSLQWYISAPPSKFIQLKIRMAPPLVTSIIFLWTS